MKTEKIVGYVLLAIGLIFIFLVTWLALSIFLGQTKVPQLVQTDSTSNILLIFFIFIVIAWAGSIISSRGVTLIKEVKLKVARESVGEEVEVVKKEKTENP